MAIATQYKIQKDVAGYNGFGLQFSNLTFSATLTASTDTSLTIPSMGSMGAALDTVNKFLAVVKVYNTAAGEVWCALNATAAIPAGSSFAATTSEMIVQNLDFAKEVKAGDVMHFFTGQTGTSVSVILYALPAN